MELEEIIKEIEQIMPEHWEYEIHANKYRGKDVPRYFVSIGWNIHPNEETVLSQPVDSPYWAYKTVLNYFQEREKSLKQHL